MLLVEAADLAVVQPVWTAHGRRDGAGRHNGHSGGLVDEDVGGGCHGEHDGAGLAKVVELVVSGRAAFVDEQRAGQEALA